MRQRKIKDIESKLSAYSRFLVADPASRRGVWRNAFSCAGTGDANANSPRGRSPLYLELGCGKGQFIIECASRDPNGLYLGFEGSENVLYRALLRADAADPANALFCSVYVLDRDAYFAEAELSGIYLNFSDPWPKARHEKRRLTSPGYLAGYGHALEYGGFLHIKTDDDDFFAYSRAGMEALSDFEIVARTEDLHRSVYARENVMTEYERKFLNLNRRINYLLARKVSVE
ncbi:MAG: tRNA (guanosine(46)-N7)-methyltransferase TrmB [Clostridiales Family XIII bacterium]|jgi:tRNA (guanine-N7-)-methyltransferase|nr:tRNA (guanosine(46)-N7)-methyltransferase TrmB [Clostridiales Family XIII bacterium]